MQKQEITAMVRQDIRMRVDLSDIFPQLDRVFERFSKRYFQWLSNPRLVFKCCFILTLLELHGKS
jgi:hypothetical protein